MQNRLTDEVEPNRLGPPTPPAPPSAAPRPQWLAMVRSRGETTSTPAVRQQAPAQNGRWLLLIVGVVGVVVALGSSIVVPALLDDPEGWSLFLSAPAAGLIAGIAAGLIAALRRTPTSGFVAALAGLALGMLVGTLTLPGGTEAVLSPWLWVMLAIAGVPLAVGYGITAFAHWALLVGPR